MATANAPAVFKQREREKGKVGVAVEKAEEEEEGVLGESIVGERRGRIVEGGARRGGGGKRGGSCHPNKKLFLRRPHRHHRPKDPDTEASPPGNQSCWRCRVFLLWKSRGRRRRRGWFCGYERRRPVCQWHSSQLRTMGAVGDTFFKSLQSSFPPPPTTSFSPRPICHFGAA